MHLEHSLAIAAPWEVVWAVTIDVERWPEWTPTMQRVERIDSGPFRVGSQARVKQPQFREAIWTVTALEAGRRFTWQTRISGMDMTATHEVIPATSGCTSLLQLEISGWPALVLGPLVRGGAQKAMATENAGLRDRCEKLARPSPHKDPQNK
ncbi:MAG TPA: SRPBCC family protein [Pirellulales bacterium]|nr:SRPBCC family protein [Pirellulales bacterium]